MRILISRNIRLKVLVRFLQDLAHYAELEKILLWMQQIRCINQQSYQYWIIVMLHGIALVRIKMNRTNTVLLSSAADMDDNKWLSLISRRRMHTNCLPFKCLNGTVLFFFKNYFDKRSGHYQTRSHCQDLVLSPVRTEIAKRSFYYTGAKYFNEFPTSIRNSKSYVTFKTLNMEYLMN